MRPKRGSAGRLSSRTRTCKDVIGLLGDYMEGGLPPGVARGLEAHLANCPSCEEFLETLRATRVAVRNLHRDDIPGDCRQRLRAFLDREMKTRRV